MLYRRNHSRPVRVGIDVGGVIIDRVANDGTDTAFRSDRFMETSAVPDAFDGIARLVAALGRDNVCIVSRCGPRTEAKTRAWLWGNNFYTHTGFDPANLHFCRERADKAPIARGLGLTDFVDDREEVLGHMQDVVDCRYLLALLPGPLAPPGLIVVRDWATLVGLILSDDPSSGG